MNHTHSHDSILHPCLNCRRTDALEPDSLCGDCRGRRFVAELLHLDKQVGYFEAVDASIGNAGIRASNPEGPLQECAL